MATIAWATRAHPWYAWKVLSEGVCDGCALGVAGFHDWTIDGVHLCTTRLELLELNTADAFDPHRARRRRRPRGSHSARELRGARTARPIRCVAGGASAGSTAISWGEALDVVGGAIAATAPASGSPGTSRAAASRTRRTTWPARRRGRWASPTSTRPRACATRRRRVGLKATIGVAASTCSLQRRDRVATSSCCGARTRPTTSRCS